MLRINAFGLVLNYINRYRIWRDCQNFYDQPQPPALVVAEDGIPCFAATNLEDIRRCTSPIVAIDCLTEGIHSLPYFCKYPDSTHYVIFSNGDWRRESVDLPFTYTLIQDYFFLFEMADTYNSPQRFAYHIPKQYDWQYPKQNLFVSTVGRHRPERDDFINGLLERQQADNFILKYSGQDLGQSSSSLDAVQFEPGQFDAYRPILEQYYHNVSQTLPIRMFNTGYFNLIVETDIDINYSWFLTEKTVKGLISGQPFVLVATPNFLHNLRRLGFKTYDGFWNEDYDTELDTDRRFAAIYDLVSNLSNFDWYSNRQALQEIGQHNQRRFWNLSDLISERFRDMELRVSTLPHESSILAL
jgi:hypothetical protein